MFETTVTFTAKSDHDSAYTKPPILKAEIHHTYYHPGDVIFAGGFPEFYGTDRLWERLKKREDSFRFHADRIDFFLIGFLHLIKHFLRQGIGVRYLMDYRIITNRLALSLTEKDVSFRLEEIHFADFARHIDRLVAYWFDKAPSNPLPDLSRFKQVK